MAEAAISHEIEVMGFASSPVAAHRRVALSAVQTYFSLTKPRVVGLVLFTAASTAFAAARGIPSWSSLAVLLVAGFLAAGGASALNHYFDRDIDGAMRRTSRRPLVTGQIRPPQLVLVTGLVMVAAGIFLAAAFNTMLAAFLLAGAFTYVVVYTLWLKRRSSLNIVIGGLAGSCAILGGWVVAAPGLGTTPLLLALLVFLWTPAHFWSLALAHREEYRGAGIPMLPAVASPRTTAGWVAVHAVWTVGASLWLQPVASFGMLYLTAAAITGVVFLAMAGRLLRRPTQAATWPLFKFSGVYLGLVFLAIILDSVVKAG